jgi:Tfp pilus assembly protein PilF
MNKKINMKALFLLPIVLILSGCDAGKPTEKETATAAIQSEVLELQKQKMLTDKTAEARTHFNQAFSYIGSAKAASTKEAKEKLMLSAQMELDTALEKDPSYVEAWLNRGITNIALGKPNKAEVDLKKAISLDPNNSSAHYNLACLYSVTRKLDLAADSLNSALQNGFSDSQSLRNDPDLAEFRKTKEFRKILENNKIFII